MISDKSKRTIFKIGTIVLTIGSYLIIRKIGYWIGFLPFIKHSENGIAGGFLDFLVTVICVIFLVVAFFFAKIIIKIIWDELDGLYDLVNKKINK
jgi:hypothetical protein